MPLHLQRQDHTEHFVGGVVFAVGVWSADVRAPVRRGFPDDLFHRNRNPATVFLDFIAAAAGPDGSRAAIHQIAARSFPIRPFEGAVETPMPFVVALAGITFLRRRMADDDGQNEHEHESQDTKRGTIHYLPNGSVLSCAAKEDQPNKAADHCVTTCRSAAVSRVKPVT